MACLLQWNIRGLGANRPSLEILMNESIVLINKDSAWSKAGNKCPFRNGALNKFSKEKLFEVLGSKASNLVED